MNHSRSARPLPSIVALALAVSLTASSALGQGAPADAPSAKPVETAPSLEAAPQDGPPRAGERRRGDRDRFGGMRRPRVEGDAPDREGDRPRRMSPEQIERVLATAREIFPEWADRLEQLREQDPEALERAVAGNARRLFALATLRERSPDLYKMKVEELRNQMELRRLADRMQELADAGDAAALESTREEIRVLATKHVDLGLRTRAMELAAMDEAIRRMRTELEADSLARDAAIDELVAAVEAGRPPAERGPDLDRGPMGESLPAPGSGPRRARPAPAPE